MMESKKTFFVVMSLIALVAMSLFLGGCASENRGHDNFDLIGPVHVVDGPGVQGAWRQLNSGPYAGPTQYAVDHNSTLLYGKGGYQVVGQGVDSQGYPVAIIAPAPVAPTVITFNVKVKR